MFRRRKPPAEIPHVEKLSLRPGDVLVLSTPTSVNAATRHAIRGQLEKQFPGHKAIVLEGGASLMSVHQATMSYTSSTWRCEAPRHVGEPGGVEYTESCGRCDGCRRAGCTATEQFAARFGATPRYIGPARY